MLLLIVAVILLGFLLLMSVVVLKRIGRIERLLLTTQSTQQELIRSAASDADSHPSGGAFEAFLNEDPKRSALSKSEQFAEFRKWRKDKGMNWSSS